MKLLCRSIRYVSDKPEEANYFSTVPSFQVGPTIDLLPVIKEESNEWVEFQFEQIRQRGNTLYHLYYPSEFELELSYLAEISTGFTLYNYFGIRAELTYTRFHIDLVDDTNTVIWKGVITPGNITDNNPEDTEQAETESQTFAVKVIGLEKEFALWNDTLSLIAPSQVAWTGTLPFAPGKRYVTLTSLFAQLFPGVPITLPDPDWVVSEFPDFRMSGTQPNPSDKIYWIPSGYDTIYQDRYITRWKFLQEILSGMGWIFMFSIQNNELNLIIRDRSPDLPVQDIDLSKKLSDFESKTLVSPIDNILVFALGLFGGDHAFKNQTELRGDRYLAFSNNSSRDGFTNLSHIQRLNSGGTHIYLINNDNNYTHYLYNYDDGRIFRLASAIYLTNPPNAFYSLFGGFPYEVQRTLFLDAGANITVKHRVDLRASLAQSQFIENTNTHIGDGDLIYWGSTPQILLKLNGSDVPYSYNSVYSDKSYTHSSRFSDNLRTLLSGSEENYYTVHFADTMITDPNFTARLINTGSSEMEYTEWQVHDFAFNPIRNQTRLTLKRKILPNQNN